MCVTYDRRFNDPNVLSAYTHHIQHEKRHGTVSNVYTTRHSFHVFWNIADKRKKFPHGRKTKQGPNVTSYSKYMPSSYCILVPYNETQFND